MLLAWTLDLHLSEQMAKKLPWTKQIVITTIAASLLLLFTCFRHVIFQYGVEVFLNAKCPVEGGWKISYGKIAFFKNRISFLDIELATKKELVAIRLEKLDLVWKSLRRLSLDHVVVCNNPIIDVYRSEGESKFNLQKLLQAPLSRYKIDIDVGQIYFHDQDSVTPVYFSVVSDEKKRSLGTFYLCDHSDVIGRAQVMMNVCLWPEEVIFELEMQDADVAWMSKITSHFVPRGQPMWEIKEGNLNGHLWLGIGENGQMHQITSILSATSVFAVDAANGLEIFTEEFAFDFSYPARKRNEMHFDVWWQNSVLKAQIKGGKIGFKDPKTMTDFALCDLAGNVNFSTFKDSEINLQGYVDHKGQISPIILSGNPSMVDKDTLDLDLKLLLEHESKCITHLNLSVAMETDHQCIVRGRLKDLGIEQIAMFQHIIGFAMPSVRDFKIDSGEVTCEVSLQLSHGKFHKLLLDNLIADRFQIDWQSKEMKGYCSHLEGSAQLDLTDYRLPTWEANLQDGDLWIGRGDQKPLCFTDINMQIFMCRDVFEPSWILATHDGVEIKVDLVGYFAEADITLGLETTGDRLLSFFNVQTEVENESFKDYVFQAGVGFQRKLGYWDVLVDLGLSVVDKWKDNAFVKCHLSDRVWAGDWNHWPALVKESISKGTFKGENVSCEFIKFANLCLGLNWAMEGVISIEGTFDTEEVAFDFNSSQIHFFSPYVDIKMDLKGEEKQSQGSFTYHAKSGVWKGFFPLHHATIYEKYLDAYFHETNATLHIEDKRLFLEDVETESEGVWMKGALELDFTKPEGFLIQILTDSVIGTAKQVESFISHIPQCKELTFPFDGRVKSGEEGVFFRLDNEGDASNVEWEGHFELTHGTYEIKPGIKVQDLSFDLDCSLSEKRVLLSNLCGVVPSLQNGDGYTINGRYLHFHLDENQPEAFFDVRVENQMMDLMRLVGSLDMKEKKVKLEENLCNFFGAEFHNVKLDLDQNYLPSQCDLAFKFPCNDLTRYYRFCLDFHLLPNFSIFDSISFLKDEGDLTGHLAMKEGNWTLQLSGSEITLGSRKIATLAIVGSKAQNVWKVDSFHLDDVIADAELFLDQQRCTIQKVTVKTPSYRGSFSKGHLDFVKKQIQLPIDEATLDLSFILPFTGFCQVNGLLEVNLNPGLLEPVSMAKLNVIASDIGEDKLTVFSKDLQVAYFYDQGLVLKEASLGISKGEKSLVLEVPTLIGNIEEGICQGYRLRAQLSKDSLHCLQGQNWLPATFDMRDIPMNVNGSTSVVFDFEWSQNRFQVGGSFEKGLYFWRDEQYQIENLHFSLDPNHLSVSLITPMMNREFTIHCKIVPFDYFETNIEAYEMREGEIIDPHSPSFIMDCKLKGPDGLSISKIEGNLLGVDFEFLPMPNMQDQFSMIFIGSAKFDLGKLKEILVGDLRDFINELQLCRGYELQGELTLVKDNWKASFFEGFLKAKDFDLLGYQIKTLQSFIRIHNDGARLTHFKLSDNAVSADIGEMKIQCEASEWRLYVPELKISDLRPSLLQKRMHTFQRLKPFHIKNMVFQEVKGNLLDITTFTGKGHLNFINTFKQGHNLLDIPLEIISRLGLDMAILVPIQGELDYVLKNGKVVFTKLRNSFSESKRSYFYLWNKNESFVDFKGNMHIDIRMKQYVLFKITELFVLSIQGTLEQPRFSLR